jgi:hypothetical protein
MASKNPKDWPVAPPEEVRNPKPGDVFLGTDGVARRVTRVEEVEKSVYPNGFSYGAKPKRKKVTKVYFDQCSGYLSGKPWWWDYDWDLSAWRGKMRDARRLPADWQPDPPLVSMALPAERLLELAEVVQATAGLLPEELHERLVRAAKPFVSKLPKEFLDLPDKPTAGG